MAEQGVSLVGYYRAYDTANDAYKTGDVGNHSIRVVLNGTSSAANNSPAEVDATNDPGLYKITLDAAEVGISTTLSGKSSTSDIILIFYPLTPNAVASYKADVSGLSTFDASADEVTTDSASRTASKADVSALALEASVQALPSAAANADAVWDEAIADHTTATTFGGKNQTDAGASVLASTGLDNISATEPTGLATTFREKICQLWARWFQKGEQTATDFKLYQSDESTVAATQALSDDGTTQTQGKAS